MILFFLYYRITLPYLSGNYFLSGNITHGRNYGRMPFAGYLLTLLSVQHSLRFHTLTNIRKIVSDSMTFTEISNYLVPSVFLLCCGGANGKTRKLSNQI